MGFAAARGRGSVLLRLEGALGPIETWWGQRSRAVLPVLGSRHRDWVERLAASETERLQRRALAALDRIGARVVEGGSVPGCSDLPEPPAVLFVRGHGKVEPGTALSVVGSRRATGYGLRIARHLSEGVAAAGVVIVSGLARGIDGMAHRGALAAGGRTLAVLGCGIDMVYPPEHGELQGEIMESGAVLSEHLPGEPPRPGHFPRRNRLIVALSQALLVVEAQERSGSLTSVRWAADLGREVLGVPGPVDSSHSAGVLALLRDGATPVGTVDHILEALGLPKVDAGARPQTTDPVPGGNPSEARFLALLGGEGLDLDELVRLSGEAPGRCITLLMTLEVHGRIQRIDGVRYRAVSAPP